MAVIVVTRLRLKDHSYLDDFFTAAVALLEQAQGSPGILSVADGRSATLTDASRANETRSFPPPVEAH